MKKIERNRRLSENYVPAITGFREYKIEQTPEKNLLADDERGQETICKPPKKGVSKVWIFYQTKRLT
jgi:hypothetical protein